MAFQLPLDPALLIRLEVRDSNLASASPGERLRRGIGPAAFDHIKGRLGHAAVKVIGATQAFVITFLYQVLMGHEPNTENMQSAVRRMALQACGENLQHHNTATLESVFTDLLHTPLVLCFRGVGLREGGLVGERKGGGRQRGRERERARKGGSLAMVQSAGAER